MLSKKAKCLPQAESQTKALCIARNFITKYNSFPNECMKFRKNALKIEILTLSVSRALEYKAK